jgi:eukaryotic-like serine/threonine-protein kinase
VNEAGLLANRYRLDRPIGAGGMGQVWAGEDTVLRREVAIKRHRLDPTDGRAGLQPFLWEARATAALQHPNIVTVYDSGTEGDQSFLIMELLPGQSLQTYVSERGPLPEREAVALAAQVASGLAAAHAVGVVHRDIKPSNLMIDANGRVKIVDFGIACLTRATLTAPTVLDSLLGSPPYLSPEQFQGEPADERSDLYALGCVLTTILTGRPPFEGEHPVAYGHQHVYAAPPPISQRRPRVTPALEALVGRLLSKDPRDRPDSAIAVLNQLTALKLAPAPVAGPSLQLAAAPVPAIRTSATPQAVPAGKRGRRGARLTATARLTVAAALTLMVITAALTVSTTAADTNARPAATASIHQQAHQQIKGSADKSPAALADPGDTGNTATDVRRVIRLERDDTIRTTGSQRMRGRHTGGTHSNKAVPGTEPPNARPTATRPAPKPTATASPTAANPTAASPTAANPTAASPTAASPTAASPTAAGPPDPSPTATGR